MPLKADRNQLRLQTHEM